MIHGEQTENMINCTARPRVNISGTMALVSASSSSSAPSSPKAGPSGEHTQREAASCDCVMPVSALK